MGRNLTDLLYLVTIVTFILALHFLSNPATARRGNQIGALGMLVAIVVTFAQNEVVSYREIAVGMVIGGAFGAVAARRVKMTAMPQMVALFNGVGGGAAALVALAEFHELAPAPGQIHGDVSLAIILSALIGAVSFSGSLGAFAQLQGLIQGRAIVLFGAFGQVTAGGAATAAANGSVRSATADDVAVMLAYAGKVVVVPGYGMAVAQAQHDVRALADVLEARGIDVTYAIHPVAGRMPGHMNVLLAEANVPYPQLKEMTEANADFPRTAVALVIRATDGV